MPNFLPEDFIEEVRNANEITDVISDYLALQPKGKNHFGLCPFHNEKTPSFSVDPERQFYHCFGCGEGGNVFSFIMAQEKLDFVESVKFLARRKGIPLPNMTYDPGEDKARKHREELYRANKEAARYYHETLISRLGRFALEYLNSRGIDHKIITSFGIGFAPDSWDSLKTYLLDKGFELQLLVEAGLILEKKDKAYDCFRNRIIIPIIDHRDRVVGFGGRVLDDSLPKYINSSESPIFNKGRTLFALNLARKRRPINSLIITEGYMDVISLFKHGIENAVASLGTALTKEQAGIIRRYTRDVFLAYDGDAAGQRATLRGLDILKNAGCSVKVISFPKGMDPDDILKKQGIESFNKLMEKARSLTDYKLDILKAKFDLKNQEDKVRFTTEAVPIIKDLNNILERDIYIQTLKDLTGFKSELIYRLVEELERSEGRGSLKKYKLGNNRYTTPKSRAGIQMYSRAKAEIHLMRLMVLDAAIAKKILTKLGDYEFTDPLIKKVKAIVWDLLAKKVDFNFAQILSYVDNEEDRGKITEIFRMEMEYDNVDRFIDDCVDELQRSQLEKRRTSLVQQISEVENMGRQDSDEYKTLIEELDAVSRATRLGPFGKEEVM